MEKGKEKSKEKSKEKILALLSANPHATTADLIAETGLSVSGVEKNIRELKAAGRLRRVGPDKGGALGSCGRAIGTTMKRDENQNVEYKESWHDKYLEWICGYAIELFTEGGNSL